MRVAIRLFARYREVAGRERLDLDLPERSTVETAWAAVSTRHPELAQYRAFTLFAVGHEYVPPDHELRTGDELCLFPPVSGGQEAEPIRASRRGESLPGRAAIGFALSRRPTLAAGPGDPVLPSPRGRVSPHVRARHVEPGIDEASPRHWRSR
jgi:molybdopterin converting factor subunit 1